MIGLFETHLDVTDLRRTTTHSVFGFIPAASIYFDDPDGHVLELLAPIPRAPRPDLEAGSWADWMRAVEGASD